MKIVYIATYPPRQCGIGTFTHNKFSSVKNNGTDGIIVAMNDGHNTYDYPEEVQFVIRQGCLQDYLDAADFINKSGADICILEHEYGIFGGEAGVYILRLLYGLQIPLIAVLHTVLKKPSGNEKTVLAAIIKAAAKTVVMSEKAVEFLTNIYGVSPSRIELVPHGVPGFSFCRQACKQALGFEDKKVLMTFGLLSRNKGIETVLEALPPIVAKHPDVRYIILGKTHPAVARHSGEEYRNQLKQLVCNLQLQEHVLFVDEFVDEEKLFRYLSATDIYITPYLNEAQIVSGTLSYALGAGCAVVSTPYWHAAELLAEKRGRLFDFSNVIQLSAELMDLLDNPSTLAELQNNARAYGSAVTWPQIAGRYQALAKTLIQEHKLSLLKTGGIYPQQRFPALSLDHINRLTDKTGVIQHAKFGIANFKEGYCLDDNARALLMAAMAYKQYKSQVAADLGPVYLSYIHYMQHEDGSFRNFLSFSGRFLDEVGSEDSLGRTIWALGYLICYPPNDAWYETGNELFLTASQYFNKLHSIRGIANTIIGICYYLQHTSEEPGITRQLQALTAVLMEHLQKHSKEDWQWFEDQLTYDNAILPLALLHAARVLHDDAIKQAAFTTMDFLSHVTLKNGYLSLIGNEHWYTRGGPRSLFAQQPVDAMGMVLMFREAYLLTGNKNWLQQMHTCFCWFLGENELGMSLYDDDTKGCCDGLEHYGINRNQGAESTLAYLISRLVVAEFAEVHAASFNECPYPNLHPMHEDFIKATAV